MVDDATYSLKLITFYRNLYSEYCMPIWCLSGLSLLGNPGPKSPDHDIYWLRKGIEGATLDIKPLILLPNTLCTASAVLLVL